MTPVFDIPLSEDAKAARATALHAKKQAQWDHWTNETIPAMIEPYMRLVEETRHFHRRVQAAPLPPCTCNTSSDWPVVCVYQNGESSESL